MNQSRQSRFGTLIMQCQNSDSFDESSTAILTRVVVEVVASIPDKIHILRAEEDLVYIDMVMKSSLQMQLERLQRHRRQLLLMRHLSPLV